MIIRSRAPLRLGLAGGGTDVSPYSDEYGGYVLNATIDLYTFCTIEVTLDHKISFYAADREEYYEVESIDFIDLDGILALHKGVYNRVVSQFNLKPLSFRMTTYSDAPAGSGLGSSSTMVVAMLKAYTEWLNLPLGEYDIAHLAYKIERIDVGLSGGKQDQYAATFGGFNFIEFYEKDRVIVNPLRIKNWIIDELESSMLLFFTGVSRDSARIIDEQVTNTLNKNQIAIEGMHELKHTALLIKEAILKGDLLSFSKHFEKSWLSKKKMSSVISNNYLEKIYDVAMEAGAYSGKVSGAGGGGFMMFIVDPVKRINVIKELSKWDGQVINFHFVKNGTEGWRV